MKIVFCLLFFLSTFYLLFFIDKDNIGNKIKKWYFIIPPIFVIVLFIIVGVIGKLLNITWEKGMNEMVKSLTIASFALAIMLIIKTMLPSMLDLLISFHKKHNSNNTNKSPLKFIIESRNLIIRIFFIASFIGSISMYYGAFFG